MTANLLTLTKEKRELPMKRHLMPATALPTMKKIALTLLCCSLLMLVAAPVWGECDPCTPTSETVTRTFSSAPGGNTQTFEFGTGEGDPNALHSFTLTLNSVVPGHTFQVALTANYVDSQVIGSTTGICPSGVTAPLDDDIDCRLAFGGFVYATVGSGDRVVPQCVAYHQVGSNAQCVWYHAATTAKPGVDFDYTGPVYDFIGWNKNTPPSTNSEYLPGWNGNNARLYDRRGEDPDNFFKVDITDWYNPNCTALTCPGGDGGGGGHQPTLNDWVWAYVPNPQGTPDAVEAQVPPPGTSPFRYIAGLPMLVAFELETLGTENHDPTAVTSPHSVGFATLDSFGNSIPVQFPKGFPKTFTYIPFLKTYFIFLSPAPYKTDGTVYTLQIDSDLFPQPVTRDFKVCTAAQIKNHTCP